MNSLVPTFESYPILTCCYYDDFNIVPSLRKVTTNFNVSVYLSWTSLLLSL